MYNCRTCARRSLRGGDGGGGIHDIVYYITVYYITLYYIPFHYSTVQYSTLQLTRHLLVEAVVAVAVVGALALARGGEVRLVPVGI